MNKPHNQESREIIRSLGQALIRHADNPASDLTTQISQLRQTAELLDASSGASDSEYPRFDFSDTEEVYDLCAHTLALALMYAGFSEDDIPGRMKFEMDKILLASSKRHCGQVCTQEVVVGCFKRAGKIADESAALKPA